MIATSPVRHEPAVNFLPTPVEVHKFPGGPWSTDLETPHQLSAVTADLKALVALSTGPDSPDTSSLLVNKLTMPRSLHSHQHSGGLILTAGNPLVQSSEPFDDDTVVSFDDLSNVMSWGAGISQGIFTSVCL